MAINFSKPMTDQDLYGQAKSLLLDKYGSLPEAGDTPGSFTARADAFRRKKQEDEAKIAQQAAEDAAKEAAKAERERASAIKSVANEEAKNAKSFLEDTYPAAKVEAETRKAEIEDAWAKDEKAAQPSWMGIVPGDPAAAARTQAHKAAWEKTQAEIDAWDQGAKDLETNTRALTAKADAIKDIEYAKDKAKVAGDDAEKDRVLNGTLQKRLHPQNPQDYRDSYTEEMARQGYELTKPDQPTAPVAQQPEQAGPPAATNNNPLPSKALEQSVAETLQKEVLAGRDAIRNRSIKDALAPGQWASMNPEQKRAFIEQFNAKKAADMAEYDATRAGRSADQKAIIEDAQGIAPVDNAAAYALKETGRRAAQTGVSAYQGFQGITMGFVDTLAHVEALARGIRPEDTYSHMLAQGARQQTEEWIGKNPEENGVASLAQSIGSSFAFLPAAALGGIPGILIAGAAQGFGPGYFEAKEMARAKGIEISDTQAYVRALVAGGIGMTEAVPFARAFNRLDKLTGGALKVIIDPLKEGAEELIQEFGQNTLQDAYDKLSGLSDKSWAKILGDGFDAGKIAALSGILMGVTMNAAAQHDWKKRYAGQSSLLDNLDKNTRHMTADRVAEIAAEQLNIKNTTAQKIQEQIAEIDKAITPTTPDADQVDANGNGTPGRATLLAEKAKLEAQLKDATFTPEQVKIAADMVDGTTGKFAANEAEISRLQAEMTALHPAKGTFWKPTDYENLTKIQEALTTRLAYREQLYRGDHDSGTSEKFRQTLAVSKEIAKFPDAQADTNGNGVPRGNSQREIAKAIYTLATTGKLAPGAEHLIGANGKRVFTKPNKEGHIFIANPDTETAIRATPLLNTHYETYKENPRAVLPQETGPVQDNQAPQGGIGGPANRPGNGAVQTREAIPGIYRVGAKSTVTGAFAPGISADVTANSEAEAIEKVSNGEVAMPTAPGNHGWAVESVVQEPQEAQYAQPEPENDAEAAAAEAIQKAKDATDSIVKPLLPLFKGVRYEIGPKNTDSGMSYEPSTGDLVVNVTNLDPKNKERTRRVAIEEAIHAALVSAKVDAAGIWKSIKDEKAREALFSAYETLRYNGTDSANGHEFLRLFFQKKIDFTPDGRLIWDENGNLKTSEEAATENASLIAKVRVALKKIIDYIDGILNGIPDTDAAKEVQRARDVLKERFEYLDSLNAPPKAEAEKAPEPEKQPEPAAEQPAPAEESATPEPQAPEFAPPPPKGDLDKLERKLSEKAFQSVNVPTNRLAAYLQGMDESQTPKTKPLSDKDVAALYEYYYAKGDDARVAIIDAEIAQRDREAAMAEFQQEEQAKKYELLEAIAIEGGFPKTSAQHQGQLDRMQEAGDKDHKARIKNVFMDSAKDIDTLRGNLEDYGFKFETESDLLDAMEQRLATGKPVMGNDAVNDPFLFSQAITVSEDHAKKLRSLEGTSGNRAASSIQRRYLAEAARIAGIPLKSVTDENDRLTAFMSGSLIEPRASVRDIVDGKRDSKAFMAALSANQAMWQATYGNEPVMVYRWASEDPQRSPMPEDVRQRIPNRRMTLMSYSAAPERVLAFTRRLNAGSPTLRGQWIAALIAPDQIATWGIMDADASHGPAKEIVALGQSTASSLASPTVDAKKGNQADLALRTLKEQATARKAELLASLQEATPTRNATSGQPSTSDQGTSQAEDTKAAPLPSDQSNQLAERRAQAELSTPAKDSQGRSNMLHSQAIPATTDKAAKTMARELKRILPHVKLTNTRGGIWIAASDKVTNGTPDTTAGGDDYTGVSVTVSTEDGKVSANVSDINSAKRKSGMGRKMLEAIAKAGVPIYHGTDWSGGFWMHIKKNYPELLNRPELRGELGEARWGVKKVDGGYQITNIETGMADVDLTIYDDQAEATEAATNYNEGFNGSKGRIFTPDMMPKLMSQSLTPQAPDAGSARALEKTTQQPGDQLTTHTASRSLKEDGIPGAIPQQAGSAVGQAGEGPQPAWRPAPDKSAQAHDGPYGIPAEQAFAGIAYAPARAWGVERLAQFLQPTVHPREIGDVISGGELPIYRSDYKENAPAYQDALAAAIAGYRKALREIDAAYAGHPGEAYRMLPRTAQARALFTDATGTVHLLDHPGGEIQLSKYEPLFSQSATPDERAQSAGQLLMEFAPLAAPTVAQDQPRAIDPLTPAQSQMVADNIGLAYMVANRATARGWDREEATQEASIGLTKAVQSFDAGRGVKFSTFAVPVIKNHLTSIGRRMANAQARDGGSLDETLAGDEGDTTTKKDMLAGDISQQQPDREGLATFRRLVSTLPANVRELMEEYGTGQTYEAIAQRRKVSRQAIQQAIQKGTRRLAERLKAAGITSSRDIFPDASPDTPTITRSARREATDIEDEANTDMQDAREPDATTDQETLNSQSPYDLVTEDQARSELGRSQPLESMVKTRIGWTEIGSLQPGDEIEDPEGGWQFIKAVYPQGILTVNRITLESGKATEASADHLWRYKDMESDQDNMVTTTGNLLEGFRIPAMA